MDVKKSSKPQRSLQKTLRISIEKLHVPEQVSGNPALLEEQKNAKEIPKAQNLLKKSTKKLVRRLLFSEDADVSGTSSTQQLMEIGSPALLEEEMIAKETPKAQNIQKKSVGKLRTRLLFPEDTHVSESPPTPPVKKRKAEDSSFLKVSSKKKCLTMINDVDGYGCEELSDKCLSMIQSVNSNNNPTISQLQYLVQYLTKLQEYGLAKCIGVKELQVLIQHLSDIFGKGLSNTTFEEKQKEEIQIVGKHLTSVLICLVIYTSENMPPTLYEEDNINNVFLFLKIQLDVNARADKKVAKKVNLGCSDTLQKCLLQVSQLITMKKLASINMHNFITSCMWIVLSVHHDQNLQMAALLVVQNIFKCYEDFQGFILKEIMILLKMLPENHKNMKTFLVNDSVKITMFSLLVMTLMQSLVVGVDVSTKDRELTRKAQTILRGGYESSMTVGGSFIVSYIEGCASSHNCHKQLRSFLDLLIADLLEVSNEPEWPAAKFLLQLIAKPLAENVLHKADQTMKVFSVRSLQKLALKLRSDELEFSGALTNIITEYQESFDALDEDDSEIIQMKLALYLLKTHTLEVAKNAQAFHQVMWYENVSKDCDNKIWRVLTAFHPVRKAGVVLTRQQARAAVHFINRKRHNFADFHTFTNYILKACYDSSKKVKAAGAQCLEEFVAADPELLSRCVVFKTLRECLTASSALSREAICGLIGKFLLTNKAKAAEYNPFLLQLLADDALVVKKAAISAVGSLIKTHVDIPLKTKLCCRVLALLQDEESSIQKQVVSFFNTLWLDGAAIIRHVITLLEMIDVPNCSRCLQQLFEELLKPKEVAVTEATQTLPETQAVLSCNDLISNLILLMEETPCYSLPVMKILSMLAKVYPHGLKPHSRIIVKLLFSPEFSSDFAIEELAAETMDSLLCIGCDIVSARQVQMELENILAGSKSLNFEMRLTVSFIKLLQTISQLESISTNKPAFLEEYFFKNLSILKDYEELRANGSKQDCNEKFIPRALIVVTYLYQDYHEQFKEHNAIATIEQFLKIPQFVVDTIHAICYLAVEFKAIMKNPTLQHVMSLYLKDKRHPKLTQAVLLLISWSLKCNKGCVSNASIKTMEESKVEIVSGVIQTFLSDILNCALDTNLLVRSTACVVVTTILRNGLLLQSRLVPYVVTMSGDPDMSIRVMGCDLLKQIGLRKTWNLTRSFKFSVLLSHSFHLKLSQKAFVRGFEEVNDHFQARNHLLYLLLQEDVQGRRKMIDAMVSELKPDRKRTMSEVLYLIDNLACFRYKYQDEVLYVLRHVVNLKSETSLPDSPPKSQKEKILFVQTYYARFLVDTFKEYIQKKYGISDLKVQNYCSIIASKDLLTKCAVVKYKISDDNLPIQRNVSDLTEKIFQTLKNDERIDSSQSTNTDELGGQSQENKETKGANKATPKVAKLKTSISSKSSEKKEPKTSVKRNGRNSPSQAREETEQTAKKTPKIAEIKTSVSNNVSEEEQPTSSTSIRRKGRNSRSCAREKTEHTDKETPKTEELKTQTSKQKSAKRSRDVRKDKSFDENENVVSPQETKNCNTYETPKLKSKRNKPTTGNRKTTIVDSSAQGKGNKRRAAEKNEIANRPITAKRRLRQSTMKEYDNDGSSQKD